MKRTPFLFIAALLAFVFIACSETDNSATEYPNWQAANEAHFDSIYNQAKADSATDKTWKILNHWSYNASVATHSYDKVVVKVVKAGTGTAATPFYTDSVRVHLQGRIRPSTSHAEGLVFEQTYVGTFNIATASSAKRAVSAVVPGLQTALLHMRVGDEWMVYVPYQLGFGSAAGSGVVAPATSTKVSIPGHSMLIYRLTLVSFYRVGQKVPGASAKAFGSWVDQ